MCQVKLVLQNAPPMSIELPDLRIEPVEIQTNSTKFDLLLDVWDIEVGLVASLSYSADLFEAVTIKRFLAHFESILAHVVLGPAALLSHLEDSLTNLDNEGRELREEEFEKTVLATLKHIKRRAIA